MSGEGSWSVRACPCGSGKPFAACCGPIVGGRPAPTAEALMRSRYTAYALGSLDHIDRTQVMREPLGGTESGRSAGAVEWIGLEVIATTGGGETDEAGTVEFAARYRSGGQLHMLHEISSFRREQGRWIYVDGIAGPGTASSRVEKVGRNAPCPCGSGKKHKRCCGAR